MLRNITICAFSLLILAGCSATGLESKRVDYKSGTVKTLPLEVPPDLTMPAAGDRYVIPESTGEVVAIYSDYSKGGVQPPAQTIAAVNNVLPDRKKVRQERNKLQRWLVVEDRAENVWPLIKIFWQENGFAIVTDNPEAGLMETDWLENRAKIPQSSVRKVISKVFDKVYSSNQKDMYRTRLERSKDGGSTEIYISHRGMEEVKNADGNGYTWRLRGSDPEAEAGMLQLLMVKLDGGQQAAAQDAAAEPAAVPASPRLQEIEGGGQMIILGEPFDRSWRKVGLALEQAGMVVDDLDRSKGVYFVRAPENAGQKKSWVERLKFWRDDEEGAAATAASKGPARYQVTVHENNAVCEVGALNMDGGRDATSQIIVELLYKQLIK